MAIATVATVALLGGCASSPDYRALGASGVGYTDRPLAPGHTMVAVSGSRAIARDDVQRYLLRRAAEVTLRAGYTYFTIGAENVDARTSYYFGGDTFLHGPDYARRAGLWPEYPNVPETRYNATAEIAMLRPDEAAGNPQAIDARSIL
jgi:hypothetical protein